MAIVTTRVPPAVEDLQQELRNHPRLLKELELEELTTFSQIIGSLCARFGIVLDGAYSEEDVGNICSDLVSILIERRKVIITPSVNRLQ